MIDSVEYNSPEIEFNEKHFLMANPADYFNEPQLELSLAQLTPRLFF